jgi:hypothetical protein
MEKATAIKRWSMKDPGALRPIDEHTGSGFTGAIHRSLLPEPATPAGVSGARKAR